MLIQSESVDALAIALASAQGEMPTVAKDKANTFFKSKYADLASVIQTVAPIITKHGLSVTQFPDFDGTHDLLTTRLIHASGQWIEASMRLMPVKQDPQSQGSALTYARRYSYCAALGIVADEDDDGEAASRTNGNGHPATSSAPAKATTKVQAPPRRAPSEPSLQVPPMRKLFAMLKGVGVEENERHSWASTVLGHEITSFTNLTREDITLLEKAAKEQQMAKQKNKEYAEDDSERPF